jgi:hypothetical protein
VSGQRHAPAALQTGGKDPRYPLDSRLGGVVVSVLATGTKGCGFVLGQEDGFLKGDKNPQHTFLRMGSKAGGPMS